MHIWNLGGARIQEYLTPGVGDLGAKVPEYRRTPFCLGSGGPRLPWASMRVVHVSLVSLHMGLERLSSYELLIYVEVSAWVWM